MKHRGITPAPPSYINTGSGAAVNSTRKARIAITNRPVARISAMLAPPLNMITGIQLPVRVSYDSSMERGRDAHIRVSHAERDQAISALGVHLSTGRLELAEFEDRCEKAAAAYTRAEVELLFGDLPSPHPDLSLATRPTVPVQARGQVASRYANSKPASDITRISPSSTMEVLVGLTFMYGIPGALVLTIWQGMWWTFLPVIAIIALAGELSRALKKPVRSAR
jgi:hypothetical protein